MMMYKETLYFWKYINFKTYYMQGYRFRIVLAGTAGIYRTGQQSGTLDPPVSYRKKYRSYRRNSIVPTGNWIPDRNMK